MLGLPFGEEKAQFRRSGDLASELCDPPASGPPSLDLGFLLCGGEGGSQEPELAD